MIPNPADYLNRETRRLGVQRDIPAEIEQRKREVLAQGIAALRQCQRATDTGGGDWDHQVVARTAYRVSGGRR